MTRVRQTSRHHLVARLTIAATFLSASVSAADPPATAALEPRGDEHAAAVLTTLAEQAGDTMVLGGWSLILAGSVATAAGVFVDTEYDASYAEAIWIGGLAAVAGGISALFFTTPIESFAREVGPAPDNLEARWRTEAARARSKREATAIINFIVGAGGLGTAAVLAANVGDMSRSTRSEWVTLTSLVGGACIAGGVIDLLVKSAIEQGYDVAYPRAQASSATLNVGWSPRHGGGALQVQGTF